ncbi:DUF547 domain-containing protein [Fontimonas sp. SYSU GA230001]|uniref:DUF547 domain-containing protein n=1 Tax=Fontimonas sp. SYSU GA230001 TaxID=3142450 RepID=UPI0032B5B9BF
MIATLTAAGGASALDHRYDSYGRLLGQHVHWVASGHASVVDYDGLRRDRAALTATLADFSKVTQSEFDGWTRARQMAFLINAYNGFTLDLILSKYPDLKSIRDLGSLLRSPWKQPFFQLLGDTRTLDWVEHDTLRPRYRDPRVHFAVNCASIGCPALRPEPYTAGQLDAQLDDQQRRFLSDRTRNRYNAADGALYLSQIFRWYGDDFAGNGQTLQDWLSSQATLLADSDADRQKLRSGTFRIEHLSYDWMLNAKPRGR